MAGNKMGEQTREKILQAAEDTFLEKGFENATVEEIARQAGVTKMMVYYHFDTKQNIFDRIVGQVLEELIEALRMHLSPEAAADPVRFQAGLGSMLDFYRDRQRILQLVISEAIRAPQERGEQAMALFDEVLSIILDLTGMEATAISPELRLRLFFFNALPMLMYAVLSETFCPAGQDDGQCRQVFTAAFAESFQRQMAAAGAPPKRFNTP